MMKYNRKEYDRMSAVLHKIMEMLTQLKPMNERLNEVIKKYSGTNDLENADAYGTYYGTFTGGMLSGTLKFTIARAKNETKDKGMWAAEKSTNPNIKEAQGEIWVLGYGYYDAKVKIVNAILTGSYRVVNKKTGATMGYTISGELKGPVSNGRASGTWQHQIFETGKGMVTVDSGTFEASK